MSINNVPSWVNWIAQDADGAWWGYSVEPLQYDQGWYENEVGERIKLGHTEPNKGWRNSLQRHAGNQSKLNKR